MDSISCFKTDSIEDLVLAVRKQVTPHHIVAIDGFHGTRKSNLAYKLGYDLRANVVSIDDYIQPNCGSFSVESVECGKLGRRLKTLERVSSVVVEGICLLEVLGKARTKYHLLIYNQAMDPRRNCWKYEDVFSDADRYQNYLAQSSGLETEVLRYHNRYRPWERADFIFRFRFSE